MSKDEILFAALVITFAGFVTSHVALCMALATRPPRLRALIAFVVVPLAPILGALDRWWGRTTLWVFFAVAYALLRLAASH